MKKTWKKLTALFLSVLMILSLTACSNSGKNSTDAKDSSPAAEQSSDAPSGAEGETYIFTDSTGREVELPVNITRAACGGPLANIMVYAVNPDVIVGWSSKPSNTAQKYIAQSLWDLPEYGKFYGNSEDFNREALMGSSPEVIIDVGEWDEEYKSDLDTLQEQLGIPVILIEANLEQNPAAFRTMGKLLGQEERGEELAAYCEDVLKDAKEKAASIPEEKRVTVYYGEGEDGLSTMIAGTIHAQIFELVGANLVVQQSDAQTLQGGGTVSMEQLMAWDPDIIAFASKSIYNTVGENETWKALKAISENKYFEIPAEPYNWLGRPPGPNRMIGVRWLGNMLYPEVFDYDIEKEVKDFFKLFYRYDLTDEEVQELLGHSTLKK